jgi:RNA polymerase sigma-70 factor (ECF subfamily)
MPNHDFSATELVRACVDSADPEIWKEFVSRFQPTIAGVALRTARRWGESSPLVVEDLVQETFVKLCADGARLLREFEPLHPGSFFGYLKVITSRVVHDYFKRIHTVRREPDLPLAALSLAGEAVDPAAESQIEREALVAEIERWLAHFPLGPTADRDRRIFWLYYRAGLSARAIAALPGIDLTVKGVESTIFRLTRLVRTEMAGSGPETLEDPESGSVGEDSTDSQPLEKGNSAKERLDK